MVTQTKRGRRKPVARTEVTVPQAVLDQIEELRQKADAQEEENKRLKALWEKATTPVIPPPPPTTAWYLCPQCKGVGEVPRPVTVKRALYQGRIDHMVCPTCHGWRMVNLPIEQGQAQALCPVFQCEKCRNWYAWGAGRPASEPCYHDHPDKTHCHWHDLSLGKPPTLKREPVNTGSPVTQPPQQLPTPAGVAG